jgi:predicted permease
MAWLEETHGVRFELFRHFLARFFDTELTSEAGAWQKVGIGLAAALFSLAIVAINTYWKRYEFLQIPSLSTRQAYYAGIRADMLSFIALAMVITAVLTALLWQRLFPTGRDRLALAGLPVNARQMFFAKLVALLSLFVAFVVLLSAPWALLFGAAASGPWQEASAASYCVATFAATAGACVFTFFGLLAVQGMLLFALPSRWFAWVSSWVQAVLFIGTLGAFPLIGRQPAEAAWWPPVWFVHLWEAIAGRQGSKEAVWAIVGAILLALSAYVLSYRKYRETENRVMEPAFRGVVLDGWIRDAREHGIFAFLWKTLLRSSNHRLLLMAFAGLALGWIAKGLLGTPRPSLRDQGLYGLLVVLAPLALALLATVALRYLFSLPVTLAANWMFQIIDRRGSSSWLHAVERFVLSVGVAPIFLASLPATIAVLGAVRGVAAMALGLFCALLWFEALFRNWRKVPFTCSYLPGRQPVGWTIARYAFASLFLVPLGQLILHSSGDPTAFVAVFTAEAASWWWLRRARRAAWTRGTLLFQEAEQPEIVPIELQPAREAFAGFTPGAERPMFTQSLSESRSLLPEGWEEEIAAERRSPLLLLHNCWEDIRYGWRLIRRSPLLSAIVVFTLTVGIGINASVFTVINGVALRPHVYRDPDRFVRVIPYEIAQNAARPVSFEEYTTYRDSSRSLRQLAAWTMFPALLGEEDDDGSEPLALAASCNFFIVDGVDRPILGRLFVPEDCQSTSQVPVAVISESIWHKRFASDQRVIGRRIQLNNHSVAVIGVVPDRTSGWTRPASFWVPYTAAPVLSGRRNLFDAPESLWLLLAGRLAPGYSRSQVEAELNTLSRQQDGLHGNRRTGILATNGSWAAEIELTASGRNLMLIAFFLGAFNLVLFISCANVATLLLSRSASRNREIAVRLSLGAPRVRLVRMLVIESLILAAAAGVASLGLVLKFPQPLFRLIATRIPDFPMPVDWHTFLYLAVVVLLSGILAGLAPALQSLEVDLTSSLKGSGALVSGAAGNARLRGVLVSAQVAMSMVLLVFAGLFGQSEDRALRGNPGYSPSEVVVAPLWFGERRTALSSQAVIRAIGERVRAIPGVRSIAYSDDLPLLRPETVEIRPPYRQDASQAVDLYTASPDFFRTLGIPIGQGREFRDSDPDAVVISQSLARLFWRGRNPLGQMLVLPDAALPIVGIARDIEPLRVGGSDNPAVYRLSRSKAEFTVLSAGFYTGAKDGVLAVRRAVREVDPDLVVRPRVLQSWIDEITETLWNVVALIVILGVVGAALTTTGIYGAVSFAVMQKKRELGIRVALGATRLRVFREVLYAGGKPVLHGLVVGLWLSVATAAALRDSVQGSPIRLDASNPLLYLGVVLLLILAALAAVIAPAHRAAQADPIEALRWE